MSQTTTARGRGGVATPDLYYDTNDGGTNLFATINALWTFFSDHINTRYYSLTLANTASTTVSHNFNLSLPNLRYVVLEGGSIRTAAQVAADYGITGPTNNTLTIQNNSGGSKTLLLFVYGSKLGIQSADFDPACSITSTGTATFAGLQQSGDAGVVFNSGATETGANWKATLQRDTASMTADAVITLPKATSTLATLGLAETHDAKTLTNCAGITMNASAALNWAAGNVTIGGSIGANTMTLGGASSTVKVAGTLWSVGTIETDSNSIVLNQSATEATTSWKATISRDTANMTADATLTLPKATATLATTALSEVLTNKDIDGGTASNTSRLTVPKAATATLAGLTRKQGTLVYDTTLNQFFADNGSALLPVGSGGGGGGGFVWNPTAGQAPQLDEDQGAKVYRFDVANAGTNQLVAWLKVPSGYVAGNQIKCKVGHYCPSVTGTMLLSTTADLIQKGAVTAVSSTTNARTSTNAAINLATSGVANGYYEASCDITDSTGKINSVAVAAGDLIRIVLTRGTDTATGDIYFPPEATEVTFQ